MTTMCEVALEWLTYWDDESGDNNSMTDEAPQTGESWTLQQRDELLWKFHLKQIEHNRAWEEMHDAVPERLHHYTTVGGLQGIIETGTLWASDVRFMNDSSELQYAIDLIDEVFWQVLEEEADPEVKNSLTHRAGIANGFEIGRQPFIACLCEDDDLLSQWRGYGYQDASVSLGFDLSMLSRFDELPPQTHLRKVVYNQAQQRHEVQMVVRAWLEGITSLRAEGRTLDELFPYPAIWALQIALYDHHLCFKHPSFSEEQEWRFIKLLDLRAEVGLMEERKRAEVQAFNDEKLKDLGVDVGRPIISTSLYDEAEGVDIKFRQSALGLIPYMHLELKDRAGVFTGRLPLWQVVLGPSTNPELGVESLKLYLRSQGYGVHTKIRASGIPLRR